MTHIYLIKHWITLHTFCNWTYNRDSIYKVFSQSYAWKEYNNVYCIIWSIFCRTHLSYYRHYIIIVYFWQWSRCVISYIMISFCSGPLSSMLHYIVHYDVFFQWSAPWRRGRADLAVTLPRTGCVNWHVARWVATIKGACATVPFFPSYPGEFFFL